jgi:hypothetical protein
VKKWTERNCEGYGSIESEGCGDGMNVCGIGEKVDGKIFVVN